MVDQVDSGIGTIGGVPWGTHLCQFYETADDMVDIIVPYFKAGLEGNERCMWVTADPLRADEAVNALRNAVPDLDRRLSGGQIEIVDHDQWQVLQTAKSVDDVIAWWMRGKDEALASGYGGFRITGNLDYVTPDRWDEFTEYERKAGICFCDQRIVALCSYCSLRCDAGMAMDVVQTHEFALARRRGAWTMIESASIKKTKAALSRANEELEVRVEQRTADLAEKNVLLQEVYHRVKNNLQVVTSLIQLRAKQCVDPAARLAFTETLHRIRAMSLVHETLYQGSDTSRIAFAAYLRNIAVASAASYGMTDRIEVVVEDSADGVGLDIAVPLGLAAVEAITNAFKHAFPEQRRGRLSIAFRAPTPEREGELLVRDDGIGTPEHTAPASRGAGLSIAAALARQLGGRVVVERDVGTVWRLAFAGPAAGPPEAIAA